MHNTESIGMAYTQRAIEFAKEWQVNDPSIHLVDIIRSVMMHRDDVQLGGHFVTAVCENDLRGALGRADSTCREHLNIIVAAYINAHVNIEQHV